MKKICFLIFILLLNMNVSYAVDESSVEIFLEELKNYTNSNFQQIEDKNILKEIISGGIVEKEKIISGVGNIFFKEVKEAISLLTKILLVTIFCSLLKNIGPQSENSVKEIAFYICYLVVIRIDYWFLHKY